jgi:hypothetical protein
LDNRLHAELWTSWAALLRSYAAAHGLNSTQHAVVEVSAAEITFRVGSRWLHFTSHEVQRSDEQAMPFALLEDGTVRVSEEAPLEMDFAAERLVREIMTTP